MSFNSFDYMFFLAAVAIIYYLLPQKVKRIWLVGVSLFFYAKWDVRYLAIIAGCIAVTYASALLVEKNRDKNPLCKWIVAFATICCIGILAVFKYSEFIISNINTCLSVAGTNKQISVAGIILSVGISFITLQGLGYVIDVYRGKYAAEKNIIVYALFMSFFPQIACGPIGRGGDLLPQYHKDVHFDVDRVRLGLLTFAYGLFLKIVVADNINAFITPIIENYSNHNGMELFLATILIGIQIYADFYGYSLMALGTGRVLSVELMCNFKQPYLDGSFRDFWRDWHISLTSWLTDYLYIPLGGNRKGKLRKYINQMIVFLCSGLWHAAAWHYIAWGGINGMYLVVEDCLGKKMATLWDKTGVNRDRKAWKFVKWLFMTFFISIAWLFFKAPSFSSALGIIKLMIKDFRPGWFLAESCYDTFGSSWQFAIILISLAVMFAVDWMQKKKGTDVIQLVFNQQVVVRWCIYLLLLYVIVCWGAYGEGFEQTQFVYFEF